VRSADFLRFYTADQEKELSALGREVRKQVNQVLGADGEIPTYSQIRYAFLSPDKAEQLSELWSDYYELRDQAKREMSGFHLPSDDAKLKLIDDEEKRDMEALLTPEEKKAYDLRNSETARQVQGALAGFDASQEEYDVIYALKQGLEEKYPMNTYLMSLYGGADVAEFRQARNAAEKEVNAQIKQTLGDARYADYARGQRQDYQTLQAAAQRFNLSAETVAQTYQVRDDAANQAKQISDDKNLSVEQKNAAYAALAEQASAQSKTALGDEIGDAYINNALVWLKNLPKGGRVVIGPKGDVYVAEPRAAKK